MFTQLATDKLLRSLSQLDAGRLMFTTPDGRTRSFEGRNQGPIASIKLNDWSVVSNMLRKGDIGFADDYRQGKWDTDDLIALTTLGLANKPALDRFVAGHSLSRFFSMLSYLLKLNTLNGSKKNIHAHYDLGNAFYKLWLDPSMTYSAAIYNDADNSLEQAQLNKYDRILDELDTDSGSLIEVGCGWGGFAERAQQRGDFDIRGITLSEEQHAFAQQRLGNSADIVLEDYRHQQGKFQNIVSIEMFEAVGERYWQTYFEKLKSMLQQKGKAVVQTITINEADFPRYRRGGDFIRSFIFPGGMLPTPTRFKQEAEKAGLQVENQFMFGYDYAKTLGVWLDNFDAEIDKVKALGFDEPFIRLWRFYLAACISGFNTDRTNVMQVTLSHR
jgi:cyclopropane-fatty-acyl-phospholipid synthase